MHITLHLTTACNFNCNYCYAHPKTKGVEMTKEVLDKALEFASNTKQRNIGVVFFGGEPLLKKELIEYAVNKCKQIEKENEFRSHYHFKITTNGALLDEDFLNFSTKYGINIGLSLDGNKEMHDANRRTFNNHGTFNEINEKVDLILEKQPYTKIFSVVNPNTLQYYAKSVEFLIERGFKYIISSLNFDTEWKDSDLRELEKQYKKIAKLYKKWTLEERKFYFSPFEMKFANHIRGNEDNCFGCNLSLKQISIAPDGLIYPCVQFVQDAIHNKDFSIGNVWDGFNENRNTLTAKSQKRNEECANCAFINRCYNTCSCLNYQTTGMINEISPILCETEKMLVPIVDKLGEELYRIKAPMFIQKHYNTAYPLLSMLEDDANSQ